MTFLESSFCSSLLRENDLSENWFPLSGMMLSRQRGAGPIEPLSGVVAGLVPAIHALLAELP
jgi:hypothetical protein